VTTMDSLGMWMLTPSSFVISRSSFAVNATYSAQNRFSNDTG
jgi:hypothetical protein